MQYIARCTGQLAAIGSNGLQQQCLAPIQKRCTQRRKLANRCACLPGSTESQTFIAVYIYTV
jgi:hypothetical protein